MFLFLYLMDYFEKPTEFNMGIATLQRMDQILRLITLASLDKNYPLWRDCIFDLERQLGGFITERDYGKLGEYLDKIRNNRWNVKDRSGHSIINPRLLNEIYFLLHDTTKEIIKIMGDKGLLMRKSSDPRFAVMPSN